MEPRSRPRIILGLVAFFGLITLFTVGLFMLPWRSEVASDEGGGIDAVITYLLVATGALVVLGHYVLIRFLWNGNGEKGYTRPTPKVEWMWGIIPVVIMMILSEAGVLVVGAPTWKKLYVDRAENPVQIEVVGKQFQWYVRYPGKDGVYGDYDFEEIDGADNPLGLLDDSDAAVDDIVTSKLRLPLGRPVQIRMRTHDVIHSFFVPDFRVKQDLIPGFPTEIRFTPTKLGEYELACSELCGLAHYRMKAPVLVMEPEAFDKWLAAQRGYFE
ncbi:MAG: hypothetical protein AAGD14_00340 [Planctomycetota bacterium]